MPSIPLVWAGQRASSPSLALKQMLWSEGASVWLHALRLTKWQPKCTCSIIIWQKFQYFGHSQVLQSLLSWFQGPSNEARVSVKFIAIYSTSCSICVDNHLATWVVATIQPYQFDMRGVCMHTCMQLLQLNYVRIWYCQINLSLFIELAALSSRNNSNINADPNITDELLFTLMCH